MELITPGIGLLFWMLVSFGIVFFILAKFAWPAVLKALKERQMSIENALKSAEIAKTEMIKLQTEHETLIIKTQKEREVMIKEAKEIKEKIITEAKSQATHEATKLIETAKENIESEKAAALTDLKNQITLLSIEIAEKILREKLSDEKLQKELMDKYLKDLKLN